MATLDNLIEPQEVVDYVRSVYERLSDNFSLGRFFPTEQLRKNRFKYAIDTRTPVSAAKYRAWDTEAPIIGRQGVGFAEAEVAPISLKMPMTEEQTLAVEAYERNEYGPMIDQIFDDLGNLTEAHVNTYEILRGEILSNATATVMFNNGLEVEIDYGLRPEHRVAPVGADWSDFANADIIGDLTSWNRLYTLNNRGRRAGKMLISQKIEGYMLRNEAIRQLLGSTLGTPSIVSQGNLRQVLASHSLPDYEVVDEQVADQDGNVRQVLDENKVTFLPGDGPVGRTNLGVTPAFLGMQDENVIQNQTAPGIIGQVWKSHDPFARWSLVESIGLPGIGNVNDLLIAQVDEN